MNLIKLSVDANKLSVTQDCFTTEGSVNFDKCEFTFDGEWDGFTKTAVFSMSDSDSYRVELVSDCCNIPQQCLEKQGILCIGVYGENDGNVIIATNTVAHRVEGGIDTLADWIEEDNSVVQSAVSQMRNSVEDFKNGLNSKFTELLKKVTDETEINYEGYLHDWYEPSVVYDCEDIPSPAKESEYDDYLDFKLNSLVRDFPHYVRRSIEGFDTDDEYRIFSYTFNPGNYSKSIVIFSCVHGTDRSSLMALSYFLDNLCRDTEDRVLAYIRNNIKLYVVPVVNPHGLVNGKKKNINDVDIGMNFPYKWSESYSSFKGESAGDCAETQTVISFLNSIRTDKICAVIDLHTSGITVSGTSIFYPKNHKNCATALSELVNNFNYNESSSSVASKAILAPSVNPTLSNYAADAFGINTCEIIWANSVYGGENENECYTKYVELLGNTVYRMALNSKYSTKEKPHPFTKYFSWKKSSNSDVYTVSNSETPVKMGISAYSSALDMPCNIVMNGYIVLDISSPCTVKINPVLYQVNSTEQSCQDRLSSSQFTVEMSLTAGTHIIPVSSVLQAYYSSYNDSDDLYYYENFGFVFALCSSVQDSAQVTAFSVTLSAFPSDRGIPVEISSPMGLASDYDADDVPTQTLIYPLGTVTIDDTSFVD